MISVAPVIRHNGHPGTGEPDDAFITSDDFLFITFDGDYFTVTE